MGFLSRDQDALPSAHSIPFVTLSVATKVRDLVVRAGNYDTFKHMIRRSIQYEYLPTWVAAITLDLSPSVATQVLATPSRRLSWRHAPRTLGTRFVKASGRRW